jgi:hypothetical protein
MTAKAIEQSAIAICRLTSDQAPYPHLKALQISRLPYDVESDSIAIVSEAVVGQTTALPTPPAPSTLGWSGLSFGTIAGKVLAGHSTRTTRRSLLVVRSDGSLPRRAKVGYTPVAQTRSPRTATPSSPPRSSSEALGAVQCPYPCPPPFPSASHPWRGGLVPKRG